MHLFACPVMVVTGQVEVVVKRSFGVVSQEEMSSMSGLEFLTGMIDGRLPAPPMARHMDFWLIEAEEGRVVFEGEPTEDHLNPMGTTHGGWFGAIMDSALGCAVMSRMPQGSAYTTLEYKVNLVAGLAPGTRVRATATTGHVGRSTAVATAEMRGVENGRLYALASTTCMVMKFG